VGAELADLRAAGDSTEVAQEDEQRGRAGHQLAERARDTGGIEDGGGVELVETRGGHVSA